MCDPQFQKLAKFFLMAKISPIFKETEVLPRKLPNFGKTNNFLFLTIKLSYYGKCAWIKLRRETTGQLAHAIGDKIIFTRSIGPILQLFQGKRGIWAALLFDCLWLAPSNLKNRWPQLDNLLRSQIWKQANLASMEVSASSVSSNPNEKERKKKKTEGEVRKMVRWFRCLLWRALFRWVCDWRICQSVKFWLKHLVWCDRHQNLQLAKFFPIFFSSPKIRKYLNS